jgi:hypothetical protein
MKNYKNKMKNLGKKMALRTAQTLPFALIGVMSLNYVATVSTDPNASNVQRVTTYLDTNENELYDTRSTEYFRCYRSGEKDLLNVNIVKLGFEVSKELLQTQNPPSGTQRGLETVIYD